VVPEPDMTAAAAATAADVPQHQQQQQQQHAKLESQQPALQKYGSNWQHDTDLSHQQQLAGADAAAADD
jgi:hypothetical protein